MFEGLRKTLVYRSRDEADWKKAQELLRLAGISCTAWRTEEMPVGGCGSKLDIRSFASPKETRRYFFSIEVPNDAGKKAGEVLAGRVLPPRSIGAGI